MYHLSPHPRRTGKISTFVTDPPLVSPLPEERLFCVAKRDHFHDSVPRWSVTGHVKLDSQYIDWRKSSAKQVWLD